MTQAVGARIRLNLAVTPAVKKRLEHLLEISEAESITEVVRRALACYEVLLEANHNKGRIIIENANGKREVLRLL